MDNELVEAVAIPMVLFCPKCGLQHIDAPDERTPDWTNPPHKSHLCHGCGTIWRPADVPTEGVVCIETRGSKDTIFYNVAHEAATPLASLKAENEALREALERAQSQVGTLAREILDEVGLGTCDNWVNALNGIAREINAALTKQGG